ncbi:MAG: Alkaline phosphatase [Thermotogales bacterium 46_20]|jgi:alkaline phosphatase|nr:MAG: Alkaline phosphatase [Thermotogales bacterium 46_20]
MKKALLLFLLVVLFALTTLAGPKYVFLFIGDGMALPQINAAQLFLSSSFEDAVTPKLNMLRFPVQGMTTTYSSNSFITDSASAGTAIATGRKTNDGVISMDPTLTESYQTVAEFAKSRGMKVGIISSVSIDHATPAVFYAHEKSRNNYYSIGLQAVTSNYDLFGGGSFNRPDNKGKDRNLFEIAVENGFTVVRTQEEFESLESVEGKVIITNEVIPGSGAMAYEIDRENEFSLADITAKAIQLLSNDNGFFIMVESGKIDWACHANDAAASAGDTIAFDKAIAEAIKFYNEHPEDTLIVVTGDHETGGLTLGFAGTKYVANVPTIGNQKMSYEAFDALLSSEKALGKLNTFEDLLVLVEDNFGLVTTGKPQGIPLNDTEIERLREAFGYYVNGSVPKDSRTYILYGGYNPVSVTLTHILNEKAGLGWTSYSHTGVPVATFAMGVGQEMFAGFYDNTDIGKNLFKLLD